ncbi:hypothetical protein C8R43DRAFT_386254 [Mycena crocata]|nr:hypothetical protein C8R43DRAFT_386254 [Mycena crocata]
MHTVPPFSQSSRDSRATSSAFKYDSEALESTSLRQINPLRPRHEYRTPDFNFALRPVSPPFISESSNAATLRAQARADAYHRAVSSASSKRTQTSPSHIPHHGQHPHTSSWTPPRASSAERFLAPPTLSVFNAPTATYMWPNFQASSQMRHGPILYARYHEGSPSSSESEDSHSDSGEPRRPSSLSSSHRGANGRYAPSRSPLRSWDPPRPTSAPRKRQPSVDPLEESSDNRGIYIHHSERWASPESESSSDSPPFDIGLPPRQGHRSSIAVGPSHAVPRSRRPSPSTVSTTHSESDRMSPVDNRPAASQLPSPPAPNQSWESYANQIRNPEGGGVYFQCAWSGSDGPCRYSSKKQLVKRHIETTHLKFKPFVCDICSKAFPQKTSLDIHRHGHTGDTPHHCMYSCGKSFKDPARRHRHYVEIHGYIPKQGKKKQQGSVPHMQEPSPYESLPPVRMSSASSRG